MHLAVLNAYQAQILDPTVHFTFTFLGHDIKLSKREKHLHKRALGDDN